MFILNFAAKTATLSDDVEMETVFGVTIPIKLNFAVTTGVLILH